MKTIIIIPYRNRESHLDYYLKNSYTKLKKEIEDLEIIVVEQTEGKKFNRGATINIGFDYYGEDDCYYITQDVDVNPIIQESIDFYKKEVLNNEFIGIYSDGQTLGGVVKFKGSTYRLVNGFPNDYWGWGHEDKDLQNRAEHFNCNIKKLIKFQEYEKKAKYFKIFQDNHIKEDSGKWSLAYRLWNKSSNVGKLEYIKNNGLTTLNYKILKDEIIQEGVRKILVEIE